MTNPQDQNFMSRDQVLALDSEVGRMALANQMLGAAQAEGYRTPTAWQPPKFCEYCGRALEIRETHHGFNTQTGAEVVNQYLTCPKRSWWSEWSGRRHTQIFTGVK